MQLGTTQHYSTLSTQLGTIQSRNGQYI